MVGFLLNTLFYVVPFLIVIGVVVTIHELGHFLAGKWLGTKIDQFSIGFGHAIAKWTDKDGVQWRIGWLPLGGFVRFSGDENAASVPDHDDLQALRADLVRREGEGALNRYFHFKPIWQRAVITAAGPIANFLLAIVIFAGILFFYGQPNAPARVDGVRAGSAAEAAGLKPGDLIVQADRTPIENFEALNAYVILRTDTPIRFKVMRAGQEIELTATPRRDVRIDATGNEVRLGVLGVEGRPTQADLIYKRYGPIEAVAGGVERTWGTITTTVHYLGRMIVGRETAAMLSGPLGMAQLSGGVTKQVAQDSPTFRLLAINTTLTLLSLIASISVGIGFLNLLPVPVLDGGHLLFYAYEAVARRPLAAKVQAAGYRVGLALVLGLMLFATWNDLQRLRVFKLIGGLFS